jgi:hypothetical protein
MLAETLREFRDFVRVPRLCESSETLRDPRAMFICLLQPDMVTGNIFIIVELVRAGLTTRNRHWSHHCVQEVLVLVDKQG